MIVSILPAMTSVTLDQLNRIQCKIPCLLNSIKEKITICFKKFQAQIEKSDNWCKSLYRPDFDNDFANFVPIVNILTALACFVKVSLQVSIISLIGGIILGFLNDKGTISKCSSGNKMPRFYVTTLLINNIALLFASDILKRSIHPFFITLPMATYGFHLGKIIKKLIDKVSSACQKWCKSLQSNDTNTF
jgi:hypothetical protein